MKMGEKLQYKVKYKIEVTIFEDHYDESQANVIEVDKSKNGKKEKTRVLIGSQDTIRQEMVRELDKYFEQLRVWYYGPEDDEEN